MQIQTVKADRVRVLSRAFDSWVVEFRIPVDELLDQERLLLHLREVKRVISEAQEIPEACLAFDGIVEKRELGEEVDVVVRIKRKEIVKGAPRVKLIDEVISEDLVLSHMHALLDIFYIDDFDQVVTHDHIMRAVRTAGICQELIQQDVIALKLQEVLEAQSEVRDVPIAHGSLPGFGSDAEAMFYFQAVGDAKDVDLLYSTRRVRKGDILCRKQPPMQSTKSGMNVLGHVLPPRQGLDFRLTAGRNAVLSLDGLDVVSELDGVAVVTRSSRRIRLGRRFKEVPDVVSVRVDPVLRISGEETADIVTQQAVEVVGNLRVGSRILSESEVYISGDVESGSSVVAAQDVLVKGNITGASIASQGSIVTGGSIQGAELHAQGSVDVGGSARDSVIDGECVKASAISSCHIVARKTLEVESIDPDEGRLITTICVGMSDFFKLRLEENMKFIEAAKANLERIRSVIGNDIFEDVTHANTHTMLMRLVTRLRLNTKSRKEIEVYRQLIEAVPPTRALVKHKENECLGIRSRFAEQSSDTAGMIIVKERIASQINASVSGTTKVIEASDQGIVVKSPGDGLGKLTRPEED